MAYISNFQIIVIREKRQYLTTKQKQIALTPFTDKPLLRLRLLTIIPRARMGSESIAHEAESRMGY